MSRRRLGHCLLPQAEAAHEGVVVVPLAAEWRQLFQFFDVPAPQDDVVGLGRRRQPFHDVLHAFPPFLAAQALEAADADVVFEGPLSVRQMSQLHRLENSIDDEGRSQAGPQTEEQHPPAAIASQRCMAASLMIFTGCLNAVSKSNPTQPGPKLCGSGTGFPRSTGPG